MVCIHAITIPLSVSALKPNESMTNVREIHYYITDNFTRGFFLLSFHLIIKLHYFAIDLHVIKSLSG